VRLVNSGIDPSEAFLAVKAAEILLRDRMSHADTLVPGSNYEVVS
jgi:hypothetical protein